MGFQARGELVFGFSFISIHFGVGEWDGAGFTYTRDAEQADQ